MTPSTPDDMTLPELLAGADAILRRDFPQSPLVSVPAAPDATVHHDVCLAPRSDAAARVVITHATHRVAFSGEHGLGVLVTTHHAQPELAKVLFLDHARCPEEFQLWIAIRIGILREAVADFANVAGIQSRSWYEARAFLWADSGIQRYRRPR